MGAWNERPLNKQQYPFSVVDAMQMGDDTSPKVHCDEAVHSTSALISAGINEEGYREVLGLDIGDNESTRRNFCAGSSSSSVTTTAVWLRPYGVSSRVRHGSGVRRT